MNTGRPRKYDNVEDMQIKIDAYFKECDNKKETIFDNKGVMRTISEPYTVSGLCLALGITRETLLEYSKKPIFSDTIKQAKQKIENWIETKALNNQINSTVSIFNLKNNFGWKDKTETEISNKEGESFKISASALDEEEIDKRILELINKK